MTHVVTENCINCKHTDCVDVCPVDCFREGPNFLVIDPDECIDCAVCIPECPVNAIFAEEDVPPDQLDFIALNAELTPAYKSITRRKPRSSAKPPAPLACSGFWRAAVAKQILAIAPLWQRACALQPIQNRSASLPQQVLQSFRKNLFTISVSLCAQRPAHRDRKVSHQCACAMWLMAVTSTMPSNRQPICTAVSRALRRCCNCGTKSASAT